MPQMMLSPRRLTALLEPLGFTLLSVNPATKNIFFIRPSSIDRLYEHLRVEGAGKKGEAVWAKTAISGSSGEFLASCIAEVDRSLVYTMQTDTQRQWTILSDSKQAKQWEKNLARHADSHCRATTRMKGPSLYERLRPDFAAIDRYIEKLGNVNEIFDSEYQYVSTVSEQRREDRELLEFRTAHMGDSSDDVRLACHVLLELCSDVEGRAELFLGKKPHEDSRLQNRILLLVDYFRAKRKAYLSTHV